MNSVIKFMIVIQYIDVISHQVYSLCIGKEYTAGYTMAVILTRWIFVSNLVIAEQNEKRDFSWHEATGERHNWRGRACVRGGVGWEDPVQAKAIFTTGGHANLILNTDKKRPVPDMVRRGKIVFRNNVRGEKIIITGSESLALILYARMSSALHVIIVILLCGMAFVDERNPNNETNIKIKLKKKKKIELWYRVVRTHTKGERQRIQERRGPEYYTDQYTVINAGAVYINVRAGDCFIVVSPERRSLRCCILWVSADLTEGHMTTMLYTRGPTLKLFSREKKIT